jgi:PAS domain S-box-containing protein
MDQTIRKKILLVEDQVIIAMSQIKLLNSEGFDVVHAQSGEEAIKIATTEYKKIDMILMDLDLGVGIDGFETSKSILNIHNIPIIFLSSQSERETIKKSEEITSYGYILKTSGAIVLIASIKIALKLAESNNRLRESELKFLKTFKYSPIPISINDIMDGNRFIDCNDAFVESTGFSKEEVIGQLPSHFNFYPYPHQREELLKLMENQGDVHNFRHFFQNKEGKITERSLTLVQVSISDKPYYLVFDVILG